MPFAAPSHGPFALRIAILGNPRARPDWSDAELAALREQGFNMLQLNIAWGWRPFDEALNLRDVVRAAGEEEPARVAERRSELRGRLEKALRHGFRPMFHFGSPFMYRNPETGEEERHDWSDIQPWYDITDPRVVEYELELLERFREGFPDVRDILVYTYDQDAWQCSEFSGPESIRGMPLHERLPGYLTELHAAWTSGREGQAMLWWEPWELSAGQAAACLERLPRDDFGIMLHSNCAEVQMTCPVDNWYRLMAGYARRLGMPAIGEGFFCGMTEELEPLGLPCPRLVDEEALAMTGVAGIAGIKEYFGVRPLAFDLNRDMLAARLADPAASTDTLLDGITARFAPHQAAVLDLLETLADGIRHYPWDASWFAREVGRADIDHGWAAGTVRGQMVETPAWRSTRWGRFMMTTDEQPHPFLLEDIGLRCGLAADAMEAALAKCDALIDAGADGGAAWDEVRRDADVFMRVARSYAFHLRETNVAMLLREDLDAGRDLTPRLADEMGWLLDADAENQGRQGRVMDRLREWQESPETFLRTWLLPSETVLEKGHHTLTTR